MAAEIKPKAINVSQSSQAGLKFAWYVAVVLMLYNTLSFIDRQILGLLVDPIKQDLGVSATRMGRTHQETQR
jgi:hypothetical protein